MQVLQSLAPVFLVIALGGALRAGGFLTPPLVAGMNRLAYWVGLPALLFFEVATAKIDFADHGDVWAAMLVATAFCMAVGYAAAALLRLPGPSAASLVQAGYRGNLAFIALPVVIYARDNDPIAVSIAVLLLAATVPVFNVVSVVVLLAGRHRFGWSAIGRVAGQLATNPLILACVGGVIYSRTLGPLPHWFGRTLESLGRMALPLALLAIGASLHLERLRAGFAAVGIASLIKVALAPLAGYFIGRWLGLSLVELQVLLVGLATPTAAASFVMADQLGADRAIAAGAIAASTLLSFPALWFVIWAV